MLSAGLFAPQDRLVNGHRRRSQARRDEIINSAKRQHGHKCRRARHGIREGAPDAAVVSLAAKVPLDIAATNRQIETYLERIYELDRQKNSVRYFYILMQALIALFTLFVSTWIARLLARQISGPIAALLRAADEVGEGNFRYRVEVGALDELAGLDEQKVQILELRYFLGATAEEAAELLGLSKTTVDRAVRFGVTWLHQRLTQNAGE